MEPEKQFPPGHSLNNERTQAEKAVREALKSFEVRKWCVEQALKNPGATIEGTEELIEYIFNFVTSTKENSNVEKSS